MQTILAAPSDLHRNPWNTNSVPPENMEKLKKSIQDLGFCTAVVVRELSDGSLQILGGQHRTEAAVELGIDEIPVVNLGAVEDDRAKKIGLVDNSRYGSDDTLALADLLEDIGLDRVELASFLPMDDSEIEQVFRAVDIDLDELDLIDDDGEEEIPDPDEIKERPKPTHTNVRFRCTNADAEAISRLIEKTISREKIDEGDEATNAGAALAHILLNS